MTDGVHRTSRLAYPGTLALLALALAFPIALMVFNPTLMFERGWEQYVGTAIYVWAVLTLGRELVRLKRDETAFDAAPALLEELAGGGQVAGPERRILPARLRQLARQAQGAAAPTVAQLMELNRESSGLDQERAAGRFTLTRYILYLLPVIGFIGTVEGISKALMNIGPVLKQVNDLNGFLNNLGSVTTALQVAFDSTLLALFLSAALMLVQTLVTRRAEDLLARVDAWVVAHALPRLGRPEAVGAGLAESLAPHLERLRLDLLEALSARLGEGLGPHVQRFAEAVDRLPGALVGLHRGAEAIGRIGDDLKGVGAAEEQLRKATATLARIEAGLAALAGSDERLEPIRRGVDRTCQAVESLSGQWAQAFERSSKTTQEQLARTLGSLKDALDLLNVSMEQGHALYRTIIKRMFHAAAPEADERAA
ncbi:MAG TPA: MotA/TolQ/ExbB proton channel family protein [Isosphaeraceae bacterium]|jgi:biopolymer transport protein ExbB/TolQ